MSGAPVTAMGYDSGALPLLLDVMRAAGAHDLDTVRTSLGAALALIEGRGHHKARPDMLAACEAAEAGEWVVCWGRAYHAICGLTWAFPPDPSACPPCPDDSAPLAVSVCGCGTEIATGHRFCHACGDAAPTR